MWRLPVCRETQLDRIEKMLFRQTQKMEKLMSAVADLKVAVAQVLSDISDETTELSNAIQKVVDLMTAAGVDNPDVVAAVEALQGTHQAVRDAITAAEAVLNPAPQA